MVRLYPVLLFKKNEMKHKKLWLLAVILTICGMGLSTDETLGGFPGTVN